MSDMVERAHNLAVRYHASQRYGDEPYAVHLQAVVDIVKTATTDERYLAAAWLHDTMEDTKIDPKEIGDIDPFVLQLVHAVTGIGHNRKARNACMYARIQHCPEAVTIKLADRIANAEASWKGNPQLFAMYKKEWPYFRQRLLPLGSEQADCLWERLIDIMERT